MCSQRRFKAERLIHLCIAGCTADSQTGDTVRPAPFLRRLCQHSCDSPAANLRFDVEILEHAHVGAGEGGKAPRHAAHAHCMSAAHEEGNPSRANRLSQRPSLLLRQNRFADLTQIVVLHPRKPFLLRVCKLRNRNRHFRDCLAGGNLVFYLIIFPSTRRFPRTRDGRSSSVPRGSGPSRRS